MPSVGFDDDHHPLPTEEMLEEASRHSWQVIHVIFRNPTKQLDSILAMVAFLPRRGDTYRHKGKSWIVEGVKFVSDVHQLPSGENATVLRAAVIVCDAEHYVL